MFENEAEISLVYLGLFRIHLITSSLPRQNAKCYLVTGVGIPVISFWLHLLSLVFVDSIKVCQEILRLYNIF